MIKFILASEDQDISIEQMSEVHVIAFKVGNSWSVVKNRINGELGWYTNSELEELIS
jgi:hypothetical protein